MSIALHTRQICPITLDLLEQIRCFIHARAEKMFVSDTLAAFLQAAPASSLQQLPRFDRETLPFQNVALCISLGGDGTFLEAAHYVNKLEIPLLGIHTGNLGFLARVKPEETLTALTHFFDHTTSLEARTVLSLEREHFPPSFALNEIALLKQDSASMLTIDAYLEDQLITTYWADGLIVATPTGSTAYSLSCSGPIMLPTSNSFVLTPVNPHNLAVRPLVVPDTATLRFFVRSRTKEMLLTVDGRILKATTQQPLTITKGPFVTKVVRFGCATLFDVLREKLYWGADSRNK